MGRLRKGMLFTISVLLLASSFLYFVNSISSYTNSLRLSTTTMADAENINMQYDSLAYGIEKIAKEETINITFQGTNISFVENIDVSNQYPTDLSRFVNFTYLFGVINHSVNISEAQNPKLTILPQNIEINHVENNITFTPENTSSSYDNITKYEILMQATVNTPWFNWTSLNEVGQGNPNAVYVHIGFQGGNGTTYITKYLDKHDRSEVHLMNSQNQSMMSVRLEEPATVTLDYNLDMYLNVIVGLDSNAYVELGTDIINVSNDLYGEKIGKVILVEG